MIRHGPKRRNSRQRVREPADVEIDADRLEGGQQHLHISPLTNTYWMRARVEMHTFTCDGAYPVALIPVVDFNTDSRARDYCRRGVVDERARQCLDDGGR
jgi:hypothetical protein